MLLWEMLLTVDNRLDLSESSRVLSWLASVPFVVPFVETGRGRKKCREPQPGCWTEETFQFFVHRLQALRSVAARLKGFKGRESPINPLEADAVFKKYIRDYTRLRIAKKGDVGAGADSSPSPRPLDRRNFDGLRFDIGLPPEAETEAKRKESRGAEVVVLCELDKFFATAFASMVIGSFAPICGRCGRQLETTPTGRKPRAKFCAKCQFAAWQDTQTDKQKRERWRRDKKQQREMN